MNAARAQGIPMMVIAMITAAISQPIAIQTPPKIIHNTLSSRERGDMVLFPQMRSTRNASVALPTFADI